VMFQFHKILVDNIRKLMFSLGPAPLVDNAHREITMFAFVRMLVGEENQLREDQGRLKEPCLSRRR